MNKKRALTIILVFTLLLGSIIYVLSVNKKYNKLVISEKKWNSLIDSRELDTSIYFDTLKFNDYNLLVDEGNSTIYYSLIDVSSRYNPQVEYTLSSENLKIAFNRKIDDSILEKEDIKVILYNDDSYKVYSLVVTSYPVINIIRKDTAVSKRMNNVDLELFDNYADASQRVVKSFGKLMVIKENEEYRLSLIKESIGHNKRDNYVSIFGMDRHNEYVLKLANDEGENKRYVRVFMNGKFTGIFSLEFDNGGVNKFEQNRENNK